MSRWFRHYAGLCRDAKLISVAIKSKQTIERVVWVYSAILESASEIDDGGRYQIDHAEIAYFLRADESDISSVEDALCSVQRVSDGIVVKWADRQFQSDRSAERTRRYRDRNAGSGDNDKYAKRETSQSNNVTSQTRHCDAPETETETETDNNSLRSLLPEREEKNGFEKKAIAKDATLSDENLEIAKTHGMKSDQATAEWQKFKAWHLSEGKKSADWDSAWALWVSRRPVQPSAETRQFGSKSPVMNVVPAIDRESSAKDVGKVWIKADTPEWDRAVQRLGREPPNVGGGWYFDKDILGSAVSH